MISIKYLLPFALCVAAGTAADAKDVEVRMKTVGAGGMMVFEPALIRAAPGDTIHFVPKDQGHNAASIPSILPKGVTPFKGDIGKPIDLKVTKSGLYGIKCDPHFGMGMVALIVVGTPARADVAAAKAAALPGIAGRRMNALLAQVE